LSFQELVFVKSTTSCCYSKTRRFNKNYFITISQYFVLPIRPSHLRPAILTGQKWLV